MDEFETCPRCHEPLYEGFMNNTTAVCESCGWVSSANQTQYEKKGAARFALAVGLLSLLIIGLFFQIRTWDKYALEVIPLQVKEQLGVLDSSDHERMAAICFDRRNYDCVEQRYSILSALNPIDPGPLLRLAKFQMIRGRFDAAAQNYRRFFSAGGNDLEARYQFAMALGNTGHIDEASKYFDQVLKAKPNVLQLTVLKNYVKLLMSANRSKKANQLMAYIRKNSDSERKPASL